MTDDDQLDPELPEVDDDLEPDVDSDTEGDPPAEPVAVRAVDVGDGLTVWAPNTSGRRTVSDASGRTVGHLPADVADEEIERHPALEAIRNQTTVPEPALEADQ